MAGDKVLLGVEQEGPFAGFRAKDIARALLRDCAFQQHSALTGCAVKPSSLPRTRPSAATSC